MSKWHLNVLKKLAEADAPMASGLHPCVNSLVGQFVDELHDGYLIRPEGRLVVRAFEELNDEQRSALMRVRSAEKRNEMYLMRHIDPEIREGLEGLLIMDGQLAQLTDEARAIWDAIEAVWALNTETRNGITAAKKRKKQAKRVPAKRKEVEAAKDKQPESTADDCTSECDECVHRDVLAMIAEKHPAVQRLVEAEMARREALKHLNL